MRIIDISIYTRLKERHFATAFWKIALIYLNFCQLRRLEGFQVEKALQKRHILPCFKEIPSYRFPLRSDFNIIVPLWQTLSFLIASESS